MNAFEQTTIFELGGVRITVVECAEIEHRQCDDGFVVTASKKPSVVLVEDERGSTQRFALPS